MGILILLVRGNMHKWSYLIEMGDSRTREAERAWKASGDDDALVAYVNELIRARATVSQSLARAYEDALLKRERNLDKKGRARDTV
jgi:hypothetical protein